MNYLDVNPMIDSLRAAPEDFSLKGKSLLHRRSGHRFVFDSKGNVQIHTACECAQLMVRPEQQQMLYSSFRSWEVDYWRPFVINREFASHFRPLPVWRKFLVRLATRLTLWLAAEQPEPETAIPENLKIVA